MKLNTSKLQLLSGLALCIAFSPLMGCGSVLNDIKGAAQMQAKHYQDQMDDSDVVASTDQAGYQQTESVPISGATNERRAVEAVEIMPGEAHVASGNSASDHAAYGSGAVASAAQEVAAIHSQEPVWNSGVTISEITPECAPE